MTLLDNIFEFMKQLKIPPSEVWKWPYWMFEQMVTRLNKSNEEENKRQKHAQTEQAANMPNMPSMSGFNSTLNNARSMIGR